MIFIEQWIGTKQHIPAIVGVLTTTICLLAFGPSNFVIPSMIAITIILTVLRKPLIKEAESNG